MRAPTQLKDRVGIRYTVWELDCLFELRVKSELKKVVSTFYSNKLFFF